MDGKISAKNRYRIFNLALPYNVNDKIMIRSERTGKSCLLSSSDAQLLLSCQTFESLDTHAQNHARQLKREQLKNGNGFSHKSSRKGDKLSVRKKEMKPFLKKLKKWSREGYLISEPELLDEVVNLNEKNIDPDPESTEITVMGIPTCNRPTSLKRCLSSFIQNFNRYGRTPDIIVLDDSRDGKQQVKNKSVLKELKGEYPGIIYYMNREQRAAFGKAVAQKTKIDPAVMEFALMGHPGCDRSEGGARNAFLLLTHGQLALQTDDDTICHIAQPPTVGSGLTLTSRPSSDKYWFFRSYDEAVKTVDFIDSDFLGVHENLLGIQPANIISQFIAKNSEIDVEMLQPSFIKKLALGDASVVMSLPGPVGDSCLFTDLYRLLLEGDSFQRLIEPPEDYQWHLSTRQVIRGVTQPAITDFTRCIGMNFAIDNRSFLPPFMPVQARCDGIFGDLLKVCFPHAFSSILPFLLAHDPPGQRDRTVDDIFSLLEFMRVNDIVAELIYASSQNLPYGEDPMENLRILGRHLINLGSQSYPDFQDAIQHIVAFNIGKRIQLTEQVLAQKTNAPQYWINHIERFISVLRCSISTNDFLNPVDITGNKITQPKQEVMKTDVTDSHRKKSQKGAFQEIIYRFGQLLTLWPVISRAVDQFDRDEIMRYVSQP